MTNRRRIELIFAALVFSLSVTASRSQLAPRRRAGRAECRNFPSKILGRPVPYCVLLPPSFDCRTTRAFRFLLSAWSWRQRANAG